MNTLRKAALAAVCGLALAAGVAPAMLPMLAWLLCQKHLLALAPR